jgi:hypothetical protein
MSASFFADKERFGFRSNPLNPVNRSHFAQWLAHKIMADSRQCLDFSQKQEESCNNPSGEFVAALLY